VTLTLEAADTSGALRGRRQIGGEFRSRHEPPAFERAGVVSAAAPQSFAPLAPGGVFAIYGGHLADGVFESSGPPLATELGNTQVLVGGRLAPLFFVSGGHLNAVAPFGVNPNTTQLVMVQRGLTYSQPIQVDVGPAQPGLFSTGGRAIAFAYRGAEQGFQVTPEAPATAGDILVLNAAGLGVTDQPVEDGAASPESPRAQTANAVTASIGGVEAKVTLSFLAPGLVGVYQVSVEVPQGAPKGDAVPLTLTVAGQSSPPALIAVR
jgi:uncharacterized protein (TIGR03437 family)